MRSFHASLSRPWHQRPAVPRLRHEATSRLFERGYQIHEVAQFTLHESWNELKRYTNLRPEDVREIPQAASNADRLLDEHSCAPSARAA